MQIINDVKLDFEDVLLCPMVSDINSRSEVSLERTFKFKNSGRSWTGIPIIAANMDTTGTFEMAKSLTRHNVLTSLHKFYTVKQLDKFFDHFSDPQNLILTTGIRPKDIKRLENIKKAGLGNYFDFIAIDVPNGYISSFYETIKIIRKMFPDHTLMAGNIVTPNISEQLILHYGVDICKIGIGPGSACSTRFKTGVGYPQLSAIMENSNAAHGVKGWICGDGGCKTPGDVAKAFCGGADWVMLGGMFAGCDECEGEFTDDGKMIFHGMSSESAMNKHYGGVAKHRAAEGLTLEVDRKGPVENVLQDIFGGVRSCATYIGAKEIKEMHKRATFVRVNRTKNT